MRKPNNPRNTTLFLESGTRENQFKITSHGEAKIKQHREKGY